MSATANDYISVRGHVAEPEDLSHTEQQAFYKSVKETIRQIKEDALSGTFGEFDASIFRDAKAYASFQRRARQLARSLDRTDAPSRRAGRALFELRLHRPAFADPQLGLQKLVHVLASDLFERRIGSFDTKAHIDTVDLGALEPVFIDHYRPRSRSVADIKRLFGLEADEPLLAFSIKPRSGLDPEDYRHLARQAFDGGVHVVELDTRDLDLNGKGRAGLFEDLTALALDMSRRKKSVCRFSANLSGPAYAVRPLFDRLDALHADAGTDCWMVKVDGNLDGLSTIQAIRNAFGAAGSVRSQPVITCYPVLKYALARHLPGEAFVRMLSLSGADIIYPGRRPSFAGDRAIDGEQLQASKEHYDAMAYGKGTADEFPMLSVAGGVMIGQVHACLSLLGGNIAIFMGGGLGLSRQGIEEAARALAKSARLARETFAEDTWDWDDFQSRFGRLTWVYAGEDDVVPPEREYVNACDLVGQVDLAVGDKVVT